MFPEIWDAVVGREVPSRVAKISGYRALCVAGHDFPGLVPAEESALVEGLLYEGLDGTELRLLDDYESSMYDRVIVEVDAGKTESSVEAYAYLVKESRRGELTDEVWQPSHYYGK